MRRRHTIISNTQAAPLQGRSERSGKGRSRGSVGGANRSRGRPSGAAQSAQAQLQRLWGGRAGWGCLGGAEAAFLSFSSPWSSLGGLLGELMEEERKVSGRCPRILPSVAPDRPREAIHLSHRSPRPALRSSMSPERRRGSEWTSF